MTTNWPKSNLDAESQAWRRKVEEVLDAAVRDGAIVGANTKALTQASKSTRRAVANANLDLADQQEQLTQAARVPAAPNEPNATTDAYFDEYGYPRAKVFMTCEQVDTDIHGVALSISRYEMHGRPNVAGESWALIAEAPRVEEDPQLEAQGLPAGDQWAFKIRAISDTGVAGEFSAELPLLLAKDETAPAKPAALTGTSRLGQVVLSWTGKTASGGAQPADFSHGEVLMSTTAGGAGTAIGQIGREDTLVGPEVPYNAARWYWVVAVDFAGNRSVASDRISVTTAPLVDTDIIGRILDGANMKLDSIQEDVIAAGAITEEKLAVDVSGKINDTIADVAAAQAAADQASQDAAAAGAAASEAVSDAAAAGAAAEAAGVAAEAASTAAQDAIDAALSADQTADLAWDAASVAVVQTTPQYALGSSETVAPTGGWSATPPTRTPGSFIWQRTVITYGNSTTDTTSPVLVTGNAGAPGEDGTGIEIAGSVATYSALPTNLSAGDAGKGYLVEADGLLYIWSGTSFPSNGNGVAFKGDKGDQGIPGDPGADGVTTYTWVKYGTSASGAGMSDSPVGKTYIGLAYNKATATESAVPGDYQWALIKGEDGTDGTNGVSVTSVTVYYRTTAAGAATPAVPTTSTPPSPWSQTEPAYAANTALWAVTRVGYSNGTYSYTPVSKVSSFVAAGQAMAAAAGKGRNLYGTSQQIQVFAPYSVHDVWYDTANGNRMKSWSGTAWVDIMLGLDGLASDVGSAISGAQTAADDAASAAEDAQQAADDAAQAAAGAQAAADDATDIAMRSADGLTTITYSAGEPAGDGQTTGDTWFQRTGAGEIVGQWEWGGSGVPHQSVSQMRDSFGQVVTNLSTNPRFEAGAGSQVIWVNLFGQTDAATNAHWAWNGTASGGARTFEASTNAPGVTSVSRYAAETINAAGRMGFFLGGLEVGKTYTVGLWSWNDKVQTRLSIHDGGDPAPLAEGPTWEVGEAAFKTMTWTATQTSVRVMSRTLTEATDIVFEVSAGLAVEGLYQGGFFSGAYSSDPDLTPSWNGPANNSTSTLTGVVPAGYATSASQGVLYRTANGARWVVKIEATAGWAVSISTPTPPTGKIYTLLLGVKPTWTGTIAARIGGGVEVNTPVTAGEWATIRLTRAAGTGSQVGIVARNGANWAWGDSVEIEQTLLVEGDYSGPHFDGDSRGAWWGTTTPDWTPKLLNHAVIASVDAGTISVGTLDADRIAAKSLTGPKLADGTVGTLQIGDTAITSAKIGNAAITEAKIGDLAVTNAKIGNLAVDGAKIANAAIVTAKIGDLAVTDAKIANLAVTTAKIQDAAITNAKIGNIDAGKITTGSLDAARIGARTISVEKLMVGDMTNYIDNPNWEDGTLAGWTGTTGAWSILTSVNATIDRYIQRTGTGFATVTNGARLPVKPGQRVRVDAQTFGVGEGLNANIGIQWYRADGSGLSTSTTAMPASSWAPLSHEAVVPDNAFFASFRIGDAGVAGTITRVAQPRLRVMGAGELIVDGSILTDKLAANAVTAAKIEAGAVTTVKLDALAVTAEKIAANAVVADKIQANAVTAVKIAADAVTADKIEANAVIAAKIAAGAVTTVKLDAEAVTADKVAANAITTVKLEANAVTAAKIAASTITANEIAANTITANEIAANTITANEIRINSITGDRILANTISAGKLQSGIVTTVKLDAEAVTAEKVAANAITADKISANAITAKHTITGALIRSAASGARTEMTSSGLRTLNSSNQELVKIGYGITTGMEVRNPYSGQMVPLAPSVFGSGGVSRTNQLSLTIPVSPNPVWSNFTRHNIALDTCVLTFTASASSYLIDFSEHWIINYSASSSVNALISAGIRVNGTAVTVAGARATGTWADIRAFRSDSWARVQQTRGSAIIDTTPGATYEVMMDFSYYGVAGSSGTATIHLQNRYISATPMFQ